MVNFNLPPEEDENKPVIKEKVKEWTLKKMADAFRNWKTKLNKFVKARETPDFEDAYYAKIRPHWPEFVAYKEGAIAKKRSKTNTLNARKKEYHQMTGSGGYISQRPKWEEAEKACATEGSHPRHMGGTYVQDLVLRNRGKVGPRNGIVYLPNLPCQTRH